MNSTRKTAIILGVLFIISPIARILIGSLLEFLYAPDYLINVSTNENQVLIVMFYELIWALSIIGISVLLIQILKKYNKTLSLGFYSLRFIESISIIVGSIFLLSLLTLSQELVKEGVPDASYYQALGTLLLAARDRAFLIGPGILFTLSAMILNYILYRSKLIPRWLSVWGLIAAPFLLASFILEFFSITITTFLFAPLTLQEMVFAVWLIVKGFNLSAINSLSTKTEMRLDEMISSKIKKDT